ncbi:hypothetical protein C8R42DRAFT_646169 [Lentinula raphanica]|nr:hypothetical protein C8R42DRAFT_646169 [Lentinula raphanica]
MNARCENQANNILKCSNCNRRGHTRSCCYAPGGGWHGLAPPNWRPPAHMDMAAVAQASGPAALSTVIDMGADVGGMASFHALATKANMASFRYPGETPPLLKDCVNENAILSLYNHVLATARESKSSPTFLDSAASESCVRNRHLFTTFTKKQAHGRMATSDSSGQFAIEGFGVVQLTNLTFGSVIHTLLHHELAFDSGVRRKGFCWILGEWYHMRKRSKEWKSYSGRKVGNGQRKSSTV